jgi:hypothetical protein
MTRKANRLVAKMVEATSRRGFLGSAVKLAAGLAAGMAGLLGQPHHASAAKPPGQKWCCMYVYEPFNDSSLVCMEGHCPKWIDWGGRLVGKRKVDDCGQCPG